MNNVGAGYGDNVATAPMLLIAPLAAGKEFASSLSATAAKTAATAISRLASASWNRKRAYVPGQEALDAQLVLLDGLGQVIKNAKSSGGPHKSKNRSKAECAEMLSEMIPSPGNPWVAGRTNDRRRAVTAVHANTAVCGALWTGFPLF